VKIFVHADIDGMFKVYKKPGGTVDCTAPNFRPPQGFTPVVFFSEEAARATYPKDEVIVAGPGLPRNETIAPPVSDSQLLAEANRFLSPSEQAEFANVLKNQGGQGFQFAHITHTQEGNTQSTESIEHVTMSVSHITVLYCKMLAKATTAKGNSKKLLLEYSRGFKEGVLTCHADIANVFLDIEKDFSIE